ncbi:MAG: PilX N-terminal domain-containing pilus assembly protein [Minicystis sp.]
MRWRSRASQRGATLFVVLLVMTLLMGIGAFAARSAHLATASSGYVRHQTQARYVGEYGLMMATALLSGSGGQSYLKMLGSPAEACTGQTTAGMVAPSCYKMSYRELDDMVKLQGFRLCEPLPGSNAYPGSLGMANAECEFGIELTDKTLGMTPSGFDTSGGTSKPLKFFYVTATATAQVRLVNNTVGSLDTTAAESSSTQTLRGRILAGPYPAN